MAHQLLQRRELLQAAGATTAMALMGGNLCSDENKKKQKRPSGSKEALAALLAGNKRFTEGKTKQLHVTPKDLIELEKGQHPFATIIGCSDSRVPIELVFDQGLGDLFVIRLAGNIVDTDVEGSLEYAVYHLQTRLVVVLGHEGCGAVTAAMAAREERNKEPIGIQTLVQRIGPALKGIDKKLPKAKQLHQAVEANVQNSVKEILAFPGHLKAHKAGKFDIVGAVYELHTGKVRILDR